jgi:hypothetical protein
MRHSCSSLHPQQQLSWSAEVDAPDVLAKHVRRPVQKLLVVLPHLHLDHRGGMVFFDVVYFDDG